MFKKITSNQWQAIKLIMGATAIIPILITFIEMIITGEESVIFLDGFNPTLALLIFVYYIFLIVSIFLFSLRAILTSPTSGAYMFERSLICSLIICRM